MLKLNGKVVTRFKCRCCGGWVDINRENEQNAAYSGFCCDMCSNCFLNAPNGTTFSGSERDVQVEDGSVIRVWNCSAPKFNWEFSKQDTKTYLEQRAKEKEGFGYKIQQIENSIARYRKEIQDCESTISYESSMNFHNSQDKIYAARQGIKRYQGYIDEAKQKLRKLRFEEYWDAHQKEKIELEAEKQSLAEQIATLNREIPEIHKKTEGYSDMVEFHKKVQNLTTEKNALGIFKFKARKAIREQIKSVKNEIATIQARIDSAIKETKNRISSLENRIKEINHEFTKPR